MQALKKIFPLSFKYTKDGGNLALGIIIYLLIGVGITTTLFVLNLVINFVAGLVGFLLIFTLPFSIFVGFASTLVGLYCLAGIIIQVLVFTKVINPDSLNYAEKETKNNAE